MNTMTGTTTRPVTFTQVDYRSRKVTATQTFPVGTSVYATENRRGGLSIRVCGTLFTQEVNGSTVEPV